MSLLFAMLPTALVVLALSMFERTFRPRRSDWWINIQIWAFFLGAGFIFLPLLSAIKVPSLFNANSMPLWLGTLLFVVVRDTFEYAYHRAQHSIPWLWSMHSLHHSDPEMSALTTQRHYWGDQVVKGITIWPLSIMIIAPTYEIFAIYNVISLWHFFVHARLPISFGRWSWLLNSPAYHRRHHSRLPEHFNSNFSALFPIFDVICGSYNRPDTFPPTGLDIQPRSVLDIFAWPLRQRRQD